MSDIVHACPVGDESQTPCGIWPMEHLGEKMAVEIGRVTCTKCLVAIVITLQTEVNRLKLRREVVGDGEVIVRRDLQKQMTLAAEARGRKAGLEEAAALPNVDAFLAAQIRALAVREVGRG